MALSKQSLSLAEAYTPIIEKWGNTQSKIIKFRYMWTVDNFSFRGEETGLFIESPEFSTGSNDEFKWCMRMNPNGTNKECKEWISLWLRLLSLSCPKSMGKMKFCILNSMQEEIRVLSPKEVHHFKTNENWGYEQFLRRDFLLDEVNCLLPKDKLTILCEVTILVDSVNISGQENRYQSNIPECKLSKDFENLFLNKKFSDVTLTVGGREFQANKAILAARSDVFAAMFQHDLEENTSNRVNVTDVDHEAFEEMLRFIYTGKALNVDKLAKELLPAADKYALERLKVMCEEALFANLSVENAADTLVLAHLHSSDQLKLQTIHFLKAHISDVVNTSGWQHMLRIPAYSGLLASIIRAE